MIGTGIARALLWEDKMKPTKMKRCRCGSLVERHRTANGGWIVHCPECSMAFGVKLDVAGTFDNERISGEFVTPEEAAEAWNEWIGDEEK